MPPDNVDLTSRRIDSTWRAFIAEFEAIYQRLPNPKPDFWQKWDAEEPVLLEKLRQRPLALSYIEGLFAAFRAKMLKAL